MDISEQPGLTEELSDEDLENVAGGALSYVVIARFFDYYSDPMPLYGTQPPDPVAVVWCKDKDAGLGIFLGLTLRYHFLICLTDVINRRKCSAALHRKAIRLLTSL